MRSEYSISRYCVARRQVIDGYLTFDFKKMTSKCRVGEQASPGPSSSPQSPARSFPVAAAAWLAARRGGGELQRPTQRLSASVPRWQGLQRPPETCGSVSFLRHWPPNPPSPCQQRGCGTCGLWPPRNRGAGARWLRGGHGSCWQGNRP